MGSTASAKEGGRMGRTAVLLSTFFAGYALLGWASHVLSVSSEVSFPVWWPASGLALGVLLRAPRRQWPALLGVIFLASLLVTGLFGAPHRWPVLVLWALANAVESLVGAALLHRVLGPSVCFQRPWEVVAFTLLGGVVGPLAGTVVAMLGALLEEGTDLGWFAFLVSWWGGSFVGVLGFGPLVLTIGRGRPARALRYWPLEGLLLGVTIAVLAAVVGLVRDPFASVLALGCMAFPLLAWVAIRVGPSGAARGSAALAILATWEMVQTKGPLPPFMLDQPWSVLLVQAFFGLASLSALVLAAVSSESERLRVEATSQARRSEEALALLQTVLRTAPVGFAFVDTALRFRQVNDVFARLGTKPASTLPGRTMAETLPELAPVIEPLLRHTQQTGEPIIESELTTGGHPERCWLFSSYPVRVDGGALLGTGVLAVDLTERVGAERERARLYRKAEEAIRIRDNFLSIASHELKTPLTPLAARLRALHRKALDGGALSEAVSLEKALGSLARLNALIDNLLDVTHLQEGNLSLRREPVSLRETVLRVTDTLRGASARHEVRVRVPEDAGLVIGDGHRLKQVLTHLIQNGIKYSPDGGAVDVSLDVRDGEALLAVADAGIGIPEDQQSQLFKRFFRARNASPSSYGGLGLGLHISHDVVTRLGGRMWVESAVGTGTTFFIALPLHHAEERSEAGMPSH